MSDENNDSDQPLLFLRGDPPSMQLPGDADLGRHSLLRIQSCDGKDLVTIDLHTGKIVLAEPDFVSDAAKSFWQAIATVWQNALHDQPLRDLVFRAGTPGRSRAGDFVFHAVSGTHGCRTADVVVNVHHDSSNEDARDPVQQQIAESLRALASEFEQRAHESAVYAGDAHDDGRHDDGDRLDAHHNSMMEAAHLCHDLASGRKRLP